MGWEVVQYDAKKTRQLVHIGADQLRRHPEWVAKYLEPDEQEALVGYFLKVARLAAADKAEAVKAENNLKEAVIS